MRVIRHSLLEVFTKEEAFRQRTTRCDRLRPPSQYVLYVVGETSYGQESDIMIFRLPLRAVFYTML